MLGHGASSVPRHVPLRIDLPGRIRGAFGRGDLVPGGAQVPCRAAARLEGQRLEELKGTENHPAPVEEHVKGSGYFSRTGK